MMVLGERPVRRSASSISRATPKNIGPAKRNTSTPLGNEARWVGSSRLSSSGSSPAVSLIRAMKSSEARVTPTPMATVRSTSTVSPKVSNNKARSPASLCGKVLKRSPSLMPHATTSRMAASAAIGTWEINLPATNDDKRTRRAADLHARTAEQGDQESGDHGSDQALVGRCTAGDPQGHREGQRHDGDGQSCQSILAPVFLDPAFAPDNEELRCEGLPVATRWALRHCWE